MAPDFTRLLAVLKLDYIRSASPTAVLLKPTGTPMSQAMAVRNAKRVGESQGLNRGKK